MRFVLLIILFFTNNIFSKEVLISELNNKTPERFLITNDIYIRPRDIVYISPSGITKWNRFFSQIFPFASFFNQVNNIND